MTSSLNSVSILVESQLPMFIRDDHPIFVEFLTKYYEFLEQPGNPIYELKKFEDNYDVDSARNFLLKYFKSKILPSFPEETELSTERIIKASKDFYSKKGTADSFKFLFRVLYNKEIEVFFPKLQILKASDGKWVQPQAFRISLSPENESLDINIIEKKKAYGSISRASCVIEAANRTIDVNTNREIIEIYVSSVNRFFQNGEYLEVEYIDENGFNKTFSEKIIGSLSNIKINPNRQGLKYKVGDPLVISGGLDLTSNTRQKAIAVVGNVTTGSIESATVVDGGYGFRTFSNTLIDIISTTGIGSNVTVSGIEYPGFQGYIDDGAGNPGTILTVQTSPTSPIEIGMAVGNTSIEGSPVTDGTLVVDQLTGTPGDIGTYTVSISQQVATQSLYTQYKIYYSTDSILYLHNKTISSNNYNFDNALFTYSNSTIGAGNTTTTVNLATTTFLNSGIGIAGNTINDWYNSMVLTIVNGLGVNGTPNSATIIDYNATTKIATLSNALGIAPGATSNIALSSNANSTLQKCLSFERLDLGKIEYVSVINGGSSFEEEPSLNVESLFDTDYSYDQGGFVIVPPDNFGSYNPATATLQLLNAGMHTYSSTDNYYNGWKVHLEKQYRTVIAYNGSTKTITLDRKFEKNITDISILTKNLYLDPRANIRNSGIFAAIKIVDGGQGYNPATDVIRVVGTGSGATPEFTVDVNGTITSVYFPTFESRGGGYPVIPDIFVEAQPVETSTATGKVGRQYIRTPTDLSGTVSVGMLIKGYGIPENTFVRTMTGPPLNRIYLGDISNAPVTLTYTPYGDYNFYTGFGAYFKGYIFGDGEILDTDTSSIGKILDIVVQSRGSDYIETPNVSLKIYDLYVDSISDLYQIRENDVVYQLSGSNYNFKGTVEYYDKTENIMRIFNYSGTPIVDNKLYIWRDGYPEDANAYEITRTYVRELIVPQYDEDTGDFLYDKVYPWHYGNGAAKATAYFLNGLIKYNGYYLNTDGHVSSDKRLQDSKKYHNFSYSLITDVPYPEYSKTILDVAHPTGTKLIPVTVREYGQRVYDRLNMNVDTAIVGSLSGVIDNCTVVDNGYAHFGDVLVVGASEDFNAIANVGDLIVINPGTDREFAKVITYINETNPVGNTELEIESPCIFVGDGRLTTNATNNVIQVTGNTDSLTLRFQVGDIMYFNVGSYLAVANSTDGSGNTTTTVNLNTTNFVANTTTDFYTGMVLTVLTSTNLPNSANIISYDGSTQIAQLDIALADAPSETSNISLSSNGIIIKDITDITGDKITLNTNIGIVWSNTNILYEVNPILEDVPYNIISVNDIIHCPSPPAIAFAAGLSLSPVISGTTTVGLTLSCTTGTWAGNPDEFTYSYQWMRDGEAIGTNSNTYTTICNDVDSNITCIVTATNGVSPNGTTATSNSLGPIVDIIPECTAAPSISLSQESCVTYYATGTGTTSFYWQDFYATRHVHEPNQIGSVFLEFAQTYHPYGAGCSSPGSSCTYTLLNETPTSFDINLISPGTTPPGGSISSYTVGTLSDTCNVLTASTGTWTANPTSFEYQWKRNGNTNIGTDSSSYTLAGADAGANITCEVTATGGNCGSQQVTTSSPYGPINA